VDAKMTWNGSGERKSSSEFREESYSTNSVKISVFVGEKKKKKKKKRKKEKGKEKELKWCSFLAPQACPSIFTTKSPAA